MISNWYSYQGEYKGNYPAFFNPTDYVWVNAIESQFDVIKLELENYFQNQNHHLKDYFDDLLYSNSKGWKTSNFKFHGQVDKNLTIFIPKLESLMNSFPEILSYGISVLEAETSIFPHCGDTDATIRCHLPIIVPASLPKCGIKVKGESRSWEVGKLVLFCDAHEHETWNLTNETRIVLIIDVLHPQNIKYKKAISKNILSLIKLQKLGIKYKYIQKAPRFLRSILRRILVLLS